MVSGGQCAGTALTLMMPEWCADSSPHSWKVSVRELCSWFEVRVVGFCDAEGVVLTGAAAYGVGSGPVFIETLRCNGDESSLLECREVNLRRESCTHARDVSVQCIGT